MEDSHEIRLPYPYRPRGRPASTAPPVPHRPWSTILLALHTLAMTVGVLAVGLGILFLDAGARQSPEGSINLGPAAVVVFGIGGLVVGGTVGVLTRMTVVGRREADEGRPRAIRNAGAATVGLAGLGAYLSLQLSFELGLLLCGLYAVPAVLLLRATGASASSGPPQ